MGAIREIDGVKIPQSKIEYTANEILSLLKEKKQTYSFNKVVLKEALLMLDEQLNLKTFQ